MTQTTSPQPLSNQEEKIIDVPSEIVATPKTHQENLGPIPDISPEDWEYNPDTIIKYYRGKPLQVLGRLINISFPFASFMLTNWWHSLLGTSKKKPEKTGRKTKKNLNQTRPCLYQNWSSPLHSS